MLLPELLSIFGIRKYFLQTKQKGAPSLKYNIAENWISKYT